MTVRIIIQDDVDGFVRFYTPYNADFVAGFKAAIPLYAREPVLSTNNRFSHWRVLRSYVGDVLDLVEKCYDDPVIEDTSTKPKPPPKTPPSNPGAPSAVAITKNPFHGVFYLCATQHRQDLFRLLALHFHPDRGGTTEAMTLLNVAWQEITKTGVGKPR